MEPSKLLENLNKEQIAAVTHGAGPLLIVAGAGTGKTTVITRRIAYLIEQNLAKPDEILALTFTDKAAGEMQDRLDLLLPLGYHDMWISTFHSFCQRILQQHGLDVGLPADFKLLNETGAWILVHNNLDKFKLDYYRPLGNPNKFISSLVKHFSRCKDELITPRDYLAYAEELRLRTDLPNRAKGAGLRAKSKTTKGASLTEDPEADEVEISRIEEIANAFHVYQKLLLDNNYLDFGDLINSAYQLFNKRPKILQLYQNKFKYVLVDEFQDTNYAQYELIKILAGKTRNLAVVGDDDQSIYKFRGASVSNILQFQGDFPELKQITLVENYRSGQEILDLAYNFIQANNPDRLEEKLKINKKLKSQSAVKCTIEVLEGKDLSEELSFVAKRINELKNKYPKSTWNDFAILLRSNSAAQELLPILSQHGIPHTFVANTGLYKKPFIADLIAYMSTLDNFHDSLALYRVLSFKQFSIPPQDLASLMANSVKKTLSLYEMLLGAPALSTIGQASQKTIANIALLLDRHAKLALEKSANEAFVEIIRDLKLESTLDSDTLENAENRELLEQFYKKMEVFVAENSDKSLHNFLFLLNLETEAGDEGQIKFDPNLGPESLKLLTVHSAKGLEFEYVFIPNMVDQRFPTRARGEQIAIPTALIKDILPEGDFHLQEERRLFYVALTRAKSHLYISWAKDYGGAKTKKPSVFLQETKLVPGPVASQATGKVFFSNSSKKDVVYQNLPKTFSFSALKTFETCPLQYKYQYYLKLPSPGSPYFSFGQTIHKVFELYLKDYQARKNQAQQDLFAKTSSVPELGGLKFLEDLYEQNWIDEWYADKKQKEDYKKRGLRLIRDFYDYTKIHPCNPKFLEKSFYLPLGDYKFTGKIDRADITDAGLEIIDYKTSEKIPSKNEKNDLDQLHIYQWAAEEFLGEKVGKLCYWYLQAGKFLPEQSANKEQIGELKSRLLAIIDRVTNTVKFDLFKEEHEKVREHRCEFINLP
ncbi:MAG: ATP-dependent DNA helicase [Candidatus Doudnabacteria bacterium]|nr:ATP-dependent DNA helicase [Candidatus Doudnabacteria bacterium]